MFSAFQILGSRFEWQIFAGLSFGVKRKLDHVKARGPGVGGLDLSGMRANKVPSEDARFKMLFAWLRELSATNRQNFFNLMWIARAERGELGRWHFHVIVCGLSRARITREYYEVIGNLWKHVGGGIADVRAFDPALDGVGYVLKGLEERYGAGANSYELGRFTGGQCEPIVSKSILKLVELPFSGRPAEPKRVGVLVPGVVRSFGVIGV